MFPQPQMVAMAYTPQEAFPINVNRKVLTGAEPPHSYTVTVVQMHTLCDGGSGDLSRASKSNCQQYK